MHVALVEDDTRLASLLSRRLEARGYRTSVCGTGSQGLAAISDGEVDVAVVDVMLPEMDGVAMTRSLRETGNRTPILMLTARDALQDRVLGLRSGADDYLVKPFAFEELVARIDALGRRVGAQEVLSHGAIRLDRPARTVTVDGSPVELTAKEFDLLECLLERAGTVVSRRELKQAVWEFRFDAKTKVVDLYVHYLRRKLDEAGAPNAIRTVRGIGYAVGT